MRWLRVGRTSSEGAKRCSAWHCLAGWGRGLGFGALKGITAMNVHIGG